MNYDGIEFGRFIARPNRFIAHVEMGGRREVCHIKNTSRLGELLVPGAAVSVQRVAKAQRKTGWDLIAVEHAGRWVNIDSQAPNKVFAEWVRPGGHFGAVTLLRPETVHGNSRFDFYLEAGPRRVFIEVKGVTLVEDGVARFPGAPTQRGVKHLLQLARCVDEGYEAALVFIVKRDDVAACGPNDGLDPAFGRALRAAQKQGVQLLALGCDVTPCSLAITRPVAVLL